ncbi:glycosyltransferase family 39 protein [Coleofasciculus sp. FACHB-64]|uniref:ArnT family glycosyltransferase n=1 Tax=Cyanophyceae TaxID=3028117 RepID=UPI00168A361E|nr:MULTISPECIES: glycosyltransferase family 39 protein [unclassified Coleofasciculus]MBD1839611.1 glycosyltransferase family 39 protein [Coleofasciculus sp. FACHB-501]MBD2047263.1 glycosyltransferase family 39 protein [Coleofasciculus sp. FACHB-64]
MKFRVERTVRSWWKSWEKHPSRLAGLSILWVLVVCWLAFVWNLGNIGLVDETEPLFAEAARQMTVTGDWITPYFNGETRFDKPPLVYWLMAIAYKLIGVNEWAVRLPSALSAIAVTGLGFYTLRYYGLPSPSAVTGQARDGMITQRQLWLSALLGAAAIALNPEMIVWGRTGVSDMLLTGCVGCALLSFFLGYVNTNQPAIQTRWYLAFYVLVALAILTKGPVGIVLPVLIIGAFLLYLGKTQEVLREMFPIRGLALVLVLAVPWYVLVILRNGENYVNKFFGYHNLERFTGVVNHHWAPWYFYFLVVLLGFAPWSIYLPVAIARLRFWQRSKWRNSPRSTHLGLFALFWFAGIFGFFTVAVTKLPSYVLPLMPAAGILVALLFSDQLRTGVKGLRTEEEVGSSELAVNQPEGEFPTQSSVLSPQPSFLRPLFWSGVVNVVFLSVLAGALLYSPNFLGYDPAVPDLRQMVQRSGLTVWGGIIWGATAIWTGWLLLKRRRWRWLWTSNLIGFMAFIIFVVTPAYFMMDRARQMPLRELSARIAQVQQPGEAILMIGFKKPSVVFYTQRPVNYFAKVSSAMEYIEAIAATQPKPPSVLILTEPKYLENTKIQPKEYQNLGKAGAYQLIRLSKQIVASVQHRHSS